MTNSPFFNRQSSQVHAGDSSATRASSHSVRSPRKLRFLPRKVDQEGPTEAFASFLGACNVEQRVDALSHAAFKRKECALSCHCKYNSLRSVAGRIGAYGRGWANGGGLWRRQLRRKLWTMGVYKMRLNWPDRRRPESSSASNLCP